MAKPNNIPINVYSRSRSSPADGLNQSERASSFGINIPKEQITRMLNNERRKFYRIQDQKFVRLSIEKTLWINHLKKNKKHDESIEENVSTLKKSSYLRHDLVHQRIRRTIVFSIHLDVRCLDIRAR